MNMINQCGGLQNKSPEEISSINSFQETQCLTTVELCWAIYPLYEEFNNLLTTNNIMKLSLLRSLVLFLSPGDNSLTHVIKQLCCVLRCMK